MPTAEIERFQKGVNPSEGSLIIRTRILNLFILSLFFAVMIDSVSAGAQEFLFSLGSEGSGPGQFKEPQGVAVDNNGNIYVADTGNNRIEKFDKNGNFLLEFGSLGSGQSQFNMPTAVAVDDSINSIFVADTGNNRIQKFNFDGGFLLSFGSQGSGNGQFLDPSGVSVDTSFNLVYVSDEGNNRIQQFNLNGGFIRAFGSSGSGSGQFNSPTGITGNVVSLVVVSDTGNNRIQVFNSEGQFLFNFGSSGSGDGQFDNPSGVTANNNNIIVTDTGNNRIEFFDVDFFSFNTSFTFEFGSLGSGSDQFNAPTGIAADFSNNRLYVADTGNNRVQALNISGLLSSINGSSCSLAPVGSQPSIPLYMLIPVFILVRRLWLKFR